MLINHPFFVGFVVSVLLAAIGDRLPVGMISITQARGIGMLVYAGVLIFLFRQGLDRDNVFWFFLGGMAGILVYFFVTL